MLFRAAVAVAVMAMTPALALADAGRTNLEIFKGIHKEIYRYYAFTVFDDVKVAIEDEGVVKLTGWVTEPFKKNEIAKRAARVDGVTEVDNAIEVLRLSRVDDELRLRVYNAIYNNPWFQHYSRPFGPIHIVVNRGDVTLTGVVDTEVDKAQALLLARQFGTFSVASELRTTAEAAKDLEMLE